jgi:hypothetical protein
MGVSEKVDWIRRESQRLNVVRQQALGLACAVRVRSVAMHYMDALGGLEDFYRMNDGVDSLWRVVRGVSAEGQPRLQSAIRVGEMWLERLQSDDRLPAGFAADAISVMLASIDLFIPSAAGNISACILGEIDLESSMAESLAEALSEAENAISPFSAGDVEVEQGVDTVIGDIHFLSSLSEVELGSKMTAFMMSAGALNKRNAQTMRLLMKHGINSV